MFPEPIPIPDHVFERRVLRKKSVLRAAWWGAALRFFVVFFELYGVYLYGSSSLLLDALGSAVDLLFSLILIICIRLAARPPDEDHPFGHGRYEPLAGLQLGVLLLLIGGGMLAVQGFLLGHIESGKEMSSHAWMFAIVPAILFEICYRVLRRTAQQQHSTALEAEAKHYRVDALTSLFALMALGVGVFAPHLSLFSDHLGAILIAIVMVVIGVGAARENMHQLMDKIPDESYFTIIKEAAQKVSGVLETEKIRVQLYGPDAHVDIDVEVDPSLSVEKAHRISQLVRVEIQKSWPAVRDVTVHIEPYYHGDHVRRE